MAGGFRDAWTGMGTAWAILGTLVAGIGTWGGVGYLADRLAGFRWLFLPIGMVIGAGTAIYLVYVRFGSDGGAT